MQLRTAVTPCCGSRWLQKVIAEALRPETCQDSLLVQFRTCEQRCQQMNRIPPTLSSEHADKIAARGSLLTLQVGVVACLALSASLLAQTWARTEAHQ